MTEDVYPWYRIAEPQEKLEQGDFIDNCQVLIPTYKLVETESGLSNSQQRFQPINVEEIRDVVVVSQTCDLENRKVDVVHLCPRQSLSKTVDQARIAGKNTENIRDNLNRIRLGRNLRYCMLNECNLPGSICEIQVVDLGTSFTVPCDIMEQMVQAKGKRIRLLSPYREYLAQMFAFLYMRVALPNPIDEFKSLARWTKIDTTSYH